MRRLAVMIALLVSSPAWAQTQFTTGEEVRTPIETTEVFSVLCDWRRPLSSASAAVATKLSGAGVNPPTGELVTSSAVTGLYDCSCPTCCVISVLDPSSCAPATKCVSGNVYQVRLIGVPTDGGKMNCNLRVDVKDIRFIPHP